MANKTKKTTKELIKYNEQYKKNTGSIIKDKLYNKIINRYTKNNREWDASDSIVWGGAIYVTSDWFGYLIFFTLFIFLAGILIKKYGDTKAIIYFMLLIMWRVQILIKQLIKLNKKLEA